MGYPELNFYGVLFGNAVFVAGKIDACRFGLESAINYERF